MNDADVMGSRNVEAVSMKTINMKLINMKENEAAIDMVELDARLKVLAD